MELIECLKAVRVIPLERGGLAWASLSWGVNGIFWLLDLYPLVKKKSRRETTAVMLLPGLIFVTVAIVSSLTLGIATGLPIGNGFPFMKKRVCVELLILAALFLAMWFLAMWLRGGRNDTWKKRIIWALSYVPDLIIVGCILTVSLARLIKGTYFLLEFWDLSSALGFTYNIFAWLYIYGIMTLLIRSALLLVAILTRLISIRIPVGAYRENSHPTRRFLWYAAICQNAYLRGVLALFVPLNLYFVVQLLTEDTNSVRGIVTGVVGSSFFIAEAFTAIVFALKPTAENLRRFSKWGDRRAFLEQFCREYFNETPVLKTSDYTITRHFLVDERSTVNVYYLEMLKGWSYCQRVSMTDHEQKNSTDWIEPHTVDQAQRSGWQWEISFFGGDICVIEKEDESADAVLKSLSSCRDSYQLGERSALQSGIRQYNSQGDGFDKLLHFGVGAVCFSLVAIMLIAGF